MSASKPRYQQLKDSIIEDISSGRLNPRDRVPSEHELVQSAGVSRMTANRALRELETEGYVNRVAGAGTFVADFRSASHLLEVRSIAEEVRLRGHAHRARVLTAERVAAPPRVAEGLMLPAGAPVSHVLVVHYENDAPIQMEDRYVCESFAPRMLEQNFSLITPSEYLSGIFPLQEAEHIVRAISPDEAVRARLQMGDEEPCLLVTRRTWAKGRPVTFVQLFHPGSRFELTGHFVPPGTNGSKYQNKLRNLNL